MIKMVLAGLLATLTVAAHAAPVDANSATRAELESVTAIGPSIADAILEERRKSPFNDWQDMINRVKGIGVRSASKLSAEGVTVNGVAYSDATPATRKGARKKPASAADPANAARTSEPIGK